MDISLFVKAVGIGAAVAMPVGPMSLLCMRTTLADGWRSGIAIGSGIAAGDAVFAAIAAFALAGLSAFMVTFERPLHIAAGLFLAYLGVKSLWPKRIEEAAGSSPAPSSGRRNFAAAILLTLTNPPTIIMFAAVFTALAPAAGFELGAAATTAAGVFFGSLAWWFFVVLAASGFRRAIGRRARLWIDRLSGAVLTFLGGVELNRGLIIFR